jgi:protein-tyrosine phosphatase
MVTDDTARFSVLMVCTGNICRSPAAERLAQARWGYGGIAVSSSGSRAMVGDPIQITMAHLLESHGAYSGEFQARQLVEQHVRDADLVLGMTHSHTRAVLTVHPAALRRTFTLREFSRIAAAVADDLDRGRSPAERLQALVSAAPERRGPGGESAGDNIRDPYGREADVYEEAFGAIRESIDSVAVVLHPGP